MRLLVCIGLLFMSCSRSPQKSLQPEINQNMLDILERHNQKIDQLEKRVEKLEQKWQSK